MTASVRLPGTGSSRITAPDSAGVSLLGDLDVRALLLMDDWTPAAIQTVIGHWNATGTSRSWYLGVNTNGTLFLIWSVTGSSTTITATSTVATGFTDGTVYWVRVTHDVDNGAAGNNVAFYTSNDPPTTAPGSVSWTQLGTTVTTAGTTSHWDTATPFAIGAISVGVTQRIIGNFFYAELRSSIAGTIVASPDFRTNAQITTPNTVFTDPQGNAWTLQSNAVWIVPAVSATGSITSTGVLSRATTKTVAGSVITIGTLTKAAVRQFAGSITPVGLLNFATAQLLALFGTITTVGQLTRITTKSLSGGITVSGQITKTILKQFAGSITATGAAAFSTIREFFWIRDPVDHTSNIPAFTRADPDEPSPWT